MKNYSNRLQKVVPGIGDTAFLATLIASVAILLVGIGCGIYQNWRSTSVVLSGTMLIPLFIPFGLFAIGLVLSKKANESLLCYGILGCVITSVAPFLVLFITILMNLLFIW